MSKLLNIAAALVVGLCFSMVAVGSAAYAQNSKDAEIRELKMEINKLLQRVEKLEQQKAEEKVKKEEVNPEIKRYVDRRIQRFSVFPSTKFLISGFGKVGFTNSDNEPSTFTAAFNPIFHYKLGDNVHLIFEPEFELEGNETEVGLEIGEIDIFLHDYLTFAAGKFALPFNVFSERLEPAWINKFPSKPVIYKGGGSPGVIRAISDVGMQLRGGAPLPLSKGSKINYAFYVVNGPQADITTEADGSKKVDISFGKNFEDTNANKAVGGRIGVLPVWNVEVGASFMYVDAGHNIDAFLLGFDGEYHYRGLELRGEYIRLTNDEASGGGNENTTGVYLQSAYRLSDIVFANTELQKFVNRLEPVFRYGSIYREAEDDIHQFAFGMDYWMRPSVPLKIAYEINDGIPSKFMLQVVVGF